MGGEEIKTEIEMHIWDLDPLVSGTYDINESACSAVVKVIL